jgi:hypothetical protein
MVALPDAVHPYAMNDTANASTNNMLVRFFIIVLQFRLIGRVCMVKFRNSIYRVQRCKARDNRPKE